MVKGVNRQVLEIHETGCEYFEKALFFIRPEYSGESDGKLRTGAFKSINKSAQIPKTRRRRVRNCFAVLSEMLISAGVGAVITALIIR